jgi:isopenicillin-N epimerase
MPPPNPFRELWSLRAGVTFLNHGSFGPSPVAVQDERDRWSRDIESEPMDWFVRRLETELDRVREELARFVGAKAKDLLFVDNATVGMNLVARSLPLQPGDEILANDHEYGAVLRIWRRRCEETGAVLKIARPPDRLVSPDDFVEPIREAITDRTRLIVVSHVTSASAVIVPVERVCAIARERGVPVCVDGPHAPAAVPIDLDRLGCDFYTASLHKWLAAPFGTGFLWVRPRHQPRLQPVVTSWGGSLAGRAPHWHDEFNWSGTRDYGPWLAIPAAIRFFRELPQDERRAQWLRAALSEWGPAPGELPGFDSATADGWALFRAYSHRLAARARRLVEGVTGLAAPIPDSPQWYGPMISLPLPDTLPVVSHGTMHPLQHALWTEHRIEAPIVQWRDRRWIRVSCHFYNTPEDLDTLARALTETLPRFG